jgi:hypothetical protein
MINGLSNLKKEAFPIMEIVFGIVVDLQPRINLFVDVSMMALQSFRLSYTGFFLSTVMEVRLGLP